jgi:serine/threonine protein kinase
VERERHYLVMRLRPAREEREAKTGSRVAVAVPLAELLLEHQQWPEWLDMQTAFEWGVQLCRIVARLHRMRTVLGDLDPSTILVSGSGPSSWAPVLVVSWPPAPQFWPGGVSDEQYAHIFPVAENRSENAFAAPETLAGRVDERSDIYSLGAILYLLFARYAPVAAELRQPVEQPAHERDGDQRRSHDGLAHMAQEKPEALERSLLSASSAVPSPNHAAAGLTGRSKGALKSARVRLTPFEAQIGIALVPPHLFNNLISPRLEAILLRALALSPAERFPSVFALVEALEALDPSVEFADQSEEANQAGPDSVGKALERMRRRENRTS